MKLIPKVLTAALLVPIALAGANSLAAPQPGVQINDEYEAMVPTPRPPAAGEFSPDDKATLLRSASLDGYTYDRTTVYVMTCSGRGMQANSVEVTGGRRGR